MKDMIIAFSLTTAVIVGVVLYYRKKNEELKEVFDEEMADDKDPNLFPSLTKEDIREAEEFARQCRRELQDSHLSPTEGFQGLPDKAPIDDIAEKAIQNYKFKKYPANRRRKKRSGK